LLRRALLRPPSSTLFPYTTLFRSDLVVRAGRHSERGGAGTALDDAGAVHHDVAAGGGGSLHAGFHGRGTSVAGAGLLHADRPERDRKSTRLNSSHVKSSYAVFCLK